MYKITFDDQPRHGLPDVELDSIILTDEQYHNLPVFPTAEKFDDNCKFESGRFFKQVRHNNGVSWPAIWISHPDWLLPNDADDEDGYLNNKIRCVFVCIDEEKDYWIAFDYYNLATAGDAYCSLVGVASPRHGTVYRLDSDALRIVRRFYPLNN